MSDKHVVAALQRTVVDLELRLREVARERDEAYVDRTRARADRDEARAEVERLGTALTQETRLSLHTQRQLDEARAEVVRMERLFQQTHGVHHTWVDARHKVAERQREACADYVRLWRLGPKAGAIAWHSEDAVRATPLVTGLKADGGTT